MKVQLDREMMATNGSKTVKAFLFSSETSVLNEGQLLWGPAPPKSQETKSVLTEKSDSPAPIPVWSSQWFFPESSFES